MKKMLLIALATCLVFAASLGFAGCSKNNETIRITHKNFTEQRIVGQLLSVYLESKGYKTTVTELSGTLLCYNALRQGSVDLYAEYTGSAYSAVLKQTNIIGVQETYDYVKKNCEEKDGITWLKPLGWNNTYVLSVRPDTAKKYNLTNISSLIPYAPEFTIGSDSEFIMRADGLPGLKKAYAGLKFKQETPMDQGLTYAALDKGELDVNSSFSTDGRIAKYGFVNLEDDKHFFPPYYITPIMKMDFAKKDPKLVELLNALGGHWTDADMQKYNLMVDEGKNAKDVAALMLKDAGLM